MLLVSLILAHDCTMAFCFAAPDVEFVQRVGRRGVGAHGVLSYPIGITASEDTVIIGDNGNDCVKVFEVDGTHKATIGVCTFFV